MRAAIYVRMSLDKTGEALGVQRQLEDCRELAARRGWQVAAEYVENDTSAAGKAKRPEFDRMLRAVTLGEYGAVIAWNLDRLTRNRRDTVRLIELGQETRLIIALARGSDLDMSTPMGRMMADQLAGWARYEIEQKSDRHKRANEQRAQAGKPHAGRRAYGYDVDGVTIIEEEAVMLKEIGERFLNGYSYTELAMFLNERGARTTMGNQFISVAVKQLLTRKRYVGIREYNGQEYPGNWTPIFDPDTWERIQLRIRERSELFGNRPAARRYLLTGLLVCGNCGTPLVGGTTRDRRTRKLRRIYRCRHQPRRTPQDKGCGRITRAAIPLDWFVKEAIIYRLDTPKLAELIEGDDTKQAVNELLTKRAALEAKLTGLVDDYADGTLTKAEFKRAKDRTRAALDDVGGRLSALRKSDGLDTILKPGDSVRSRWEAETDGWQRQLIDLLIERITVNSGRKLPRVQIDGKTHYFDSELVDIEWRF